MLFNSLNFLIFLPVVFILYWFTSKKSLTYQNILLLLSSYFFYSCWDVRFLLLLFFSTLLDYVTGLKIWRAKSIEARKFWIWLSISINLCILGIFKYYNFFVVSFADALAQIGLHTNPWLLQIILPVGISFYTFHGLSYVIDIYYRRIEAERDFIKYGLFVSFFPLLVAGPIERATHLLPQIRVLRTFSYEQIVDGLKQILWGLFKKIVIADQCAKYANDIFNNAGDYTGSTLILGLFFFAFQIYGDFSGYSDIALGVAKLFGINLLKNFNFPYFSRDIAEFWRRWHISLSSWFRDYLYIPLGGSKNGTLITIRNILIIFIVSGFWHGANWTFIIWGALHAVYIIPSIAFNTHRSHLEIVAKDRVLPTAKDFFQISATFCLVSFSWIFFRAQSLSDAINYISKIFSISTFTMPRFTNGTLALPAVFLTLLFIFIEWQGRRNNYAIEKIFTKRNSIRWLAYYMLIFMIIIFSGSDEQFIYFQF